MYSTWPSSSISLLLFFLLLSNCQSPTAPNMLPTNFDTRACRTALEKVFAKNELMGMSVILLNEDQIVYEDYFGQADSARQIPISEATMYRIASISKSITATAVLQLVEQNKLSFDL